MTMLLDIFKLRSENKRLKVELEQKKITIQYLNACVSKANKRYIELLKQYGICPNTLEVIKSIEGLDFPNSSVEGNQISIYDILEN